MCKTFIHLRHLCPLELLSYSILCLLAMLLGSRVIEAAPLEIEDTPAPLRERSAATDGMQDRLHAAALFAAGRVQEQRGNETAALSKFARAYRYDATLTVLRDILRLAATLDRHEEALRYALLATDTLPLHQTIDAEQLRPLALVLTQQGEWDSALNLYEVLLRQQNFEASGETTSAPSFTELTIRQEAIRLYFLTGRFAAGAKIVASLEAALADPQKFKLTTAQHKELLGEANLTYHLFAECYLAAGAFEAAKRCYETADKHQPNAGILGYNLARIAQQQNRPEQALEHLQAYFTAQLAGEGSAPYKLLGDLLAVLEQSDQFDERLARLREADSANVPLALFVAQRLLSAEKYAAAEAIYAQLAKTPSKRHAPAIYQGWLQCLWKQQKLDVLLQTLGETEAKTNSAVSEVALNLIAADEQVRRQLIELARTRRNPSAEKLPPANEAWTIAELALAGGDIPTALEFFEFALQDQPKRKAELLETFGVMLLLADRTSESAAIFRRGVDDQELQNKRTSFQYYLASAWALLDKTDEALKLARRAAASAPDDPRYATRIGWILQRAKRYDEALDVYLSVLKQFDEQYDSSANREAMRDVRQIVSNLYVLQGNLPQGVEYLEQVLDEFPTHVGALNDLGYLWAEHNQHLPRAKRMIEQAVAAEPDNRAFLDSLGWVEYRLKNYEAARAALEKALLGEETPDSEMLEHLGDVYFKLNEHDKAKQQWQRALDSLPTEASAERRQALEQKAGM